MIKMQNSKNQLLFQMKNVQKQVKMSERSYYRIGGYVSWVLTPESWRELLEMVLGLQKQRIPWTVIGSGSNVVFADEFSEEIAVISLENLHRFFWKDSETLFVEAGVSHTEIAVTCLENERLGGHWMFRLPGLVGAGIRMNARCYGYEMSQYVRAIWVMELDGRCFWYPATHFFYGYKETLLTRKPGIVLGALFQFPHQGSKDDILRAMQECEQDRLKKHHFDAPSCGSTFKNNYDVGEPSGKIFESLGFKGVRCGDAEVSLFHANFIFNKGNACCKDILSLCALMRKRAWEERKALLDLELIPIGKFDAQTVADCGLERVGLLMKDAKDVGSEESLEKEKVFSSECLLELKGEAQSEYYWSGMLWHPSIQNESVSLSFPVVLFETPFLDYFYSDHSGNIPAVMQLVQVCSWDEALQNPLRPFLQWRTLLGEGWEAFFTEKPVQPEGTFVDGLWQWSVSELFLGVEPSDDAPYVEFEVTPWGHWVALAHRRRRERLEMHQNPRAELWQGINVRTFNAEPSFPEFSKFLCLFQGEVLRCLEVSFSLESLAVLSLDKLWASCNKRLWFQGALSLGKGRYFLAPHWQNLQNIRNKRPDFHQPALFSFVTLV